MRYNTIFSFLIPYNHTRKNNMARADNFFRIPQIHTEGFSQFTGKPYRTIYQPYRD